MPRSAHPVTGSARIWLREVFSSMVVQQAPVAGRASYCCSGLWVAGLGQSEAGEPRWIWWLGSRSM